MKEAKKVNKAEKKIKGKYKYDPGKRLKSPQGKTRDPKYGVTIRYIALINSPNKSL